MPRMRVEAQLAEKHLITHKDSEWNVGALVCEKVHELLGARNTMLLTYIYTNET